MRRAHYDRRFYVYILASWNRCIYTGMTSDLTHRVNQHAMGLGAAFTSKYKTKRLVHYEVFQDRRVAMAREKEIKGWRREKKIALIEDSNPTWDDLPAPWSQ
jgi:putative endonuclease